MWRKLTWGKLDVAEDPDRTQEVADFSGKVLGSWDICHYPVENQILPTTICIHLYTIFSYKQRVFLIYKERNLVFFSFFPNSEYFGESI